MRVRVPSDVAVVEESGAELRIVIPPNPPQGLGKATLFAVSGLLLALVASMIVTVQEAGFGVALMGPALFALALAAMLLPRRRWRRFVREGREVVVVDEAGLRITHEIGEDRRSWSYPLEDLSRLRLETPDAEIGAGEDVPDRHGQLPGLLAVTHRVTPIRFGLGLDRAEARRILHRLATFLRAHGQAALAASASPASEAPASPDAEASLRERPLASRSRGFLLGPVVSAAILLAPLVLWAGLMTAGLATSWADGDGPNPLHVLLSLAPTMIILVAAVPPLLFASVGRESFRIAGDDLVVERSLLGWKRRLVYELRAIENPRCRRGASDLRPRPRRVESWTWPLVTPFELMRRRRLLFDYGAASIDCGAFLGEGTADQAARGLAADLAQVSEHAAGSSAAPAEVGAAEA